MTKLVLAAAAAVILGAPLAHAETVRSERNVGLDLANQIAAAGVAACAEKGHAVAVTVVDRAGVVRAVQRADNAGPHTLGSSQQKAWTAASAKAPTGALMEASQKNAGAANLGDIPGFLLLAGGLPIKAGNDVIGGVGIGGAPAGSIDEQCAQAALDKVKDQLR
jgi:uncharacterized protein GlcG (DUF336 family)